MSISTTISPPAAALLAKLETMELEAAHNRIRLQILDDMCEDPNGTAHFDLTDAEQAERQEINTHFAEMITLKRLWNGRMGTGDGKPVLIYRFHAFEPPRADQFLIPQPLKHLGFYKHETRTIIPSDIAPELPTTCKEWDSAFNITVSAQWRMPYAEAQHIICKHENAAKAARAAAILKAVA